MEKKTDKLDILIEKIREAKPILHDAENLTASIMQRIENKSPRLESRWIIWIRAVSSSAAVLLIGLFIFQQTESTNAVANNNQTYFIENKIDMDTLPDHKLCGNQTSLMKAYLCYMQQNSVKNNQSRDYYKQSYN